MKLMQILVCPVGENKEAALLNASLVLDTVIVVLAVRRGCRV